ncbi:GGDEF domain-containing protein, partial [bacterium]|nr:GGDEF domain-containing protein [bacterium]
MKKIIQFFKAFLRSGATILELRKQILELREQSIRDPLTQVYNRRFLEEVGEKEFERAKRYQRPLTLILLDVDGLKKINDQRGHLVGDQALKTIAALLSNHSRKSDFIFRYGGDEFLAIMPEVEEKGARQFLNRINQ